MSTAKFEGQKPPLYVWALVLASVGMEWCYESPAILALPLKEAHSISGENIQEMYAAWAAPGIVFQFLCGFFITRFDALSSGIVYFGFWLSECVVDTGMFTGSFQLMYWGRIGHGFFGEISYVAAFANVNKYLPENQKGRTITIFFLCSRINSIINIWITPEIYEATQSLGPPLACGNLMCIFGFCMWAIFYFGNPNVRAGIAYNQIEANGTPSGSDEKKITKTKEELESMTFLQKAKDFFGKITMSYVCLLVWFTCQSIASYGFHNYRLQFFVSRYSLSYLEAKNIHVMYSGFYLGFSLFQTFYLNDKITRKSLLMLLPSVAMTFMFVEHYCEKENPWVGMAYANVFQHGIIGACHEPAYWTLLDTLQPLGYEAIGISLASWFNQVGYTIGYAHHGTILGSGALTPVKIQNSLWFLGSLTAVSVVMALAYSAFEKTGDPKDADSEMAQAYSDFEKSEDSKYAGGEKVKTD